MSRGRLFTMLGSALVMVIMPNLYPKTGWLFAAAVMAVAALVFMQPFGFVAKERFAPEGASVTLKDIFRTLVSNKYLLIFCIGLLIGNLLNTTTTISGYFAIYNLGGAEMIPLITTVPLLGSVVFPDCQRLLYPIGRRNAFEAGLSQGRKEKRSVRRQTFPGTGRRAYSGFRIPSSGGATAWGNSPCTGSLRSCGRQQGSGWTQEIAGWDLGHWS